MNFDKDAEPLSAAEAWQFMAVCGLAILALILFVSFVARLV